MITEQEFLTALPLALDAAQQAAMRIAGCHALLLAVPGSGKTAVILARVGHMRFCRDIPAGSILNVTFSRAAAAEMRTRYAALFPTEGEGAPAFRTIHSVCREIVLGHCRAVGSEPPALLHDRHGTLRALYLRLFPESEYPDDARISALDRRVSYAKNMLLKEEQLASLDLEGVRFAQLFHAYEAQNAARSMMDFDDQLVMAYRLLRADPALLAQLRARWRYLNVDEAQDTSYVQHRILYLLAQGGELFMVGDEDQSIYGFRAAYPDIFLRFGEIYPGATILKLETNYRSSAVITSAANRFIERNAHRTSKQMRAVRPGGAAIQTTEFLHVKAQYDYLARTLASLPPGKTAAVLYRNNESALPLLLPLEARKVSFSVRGERAAEFFTRAHVRHALNVLRFAHAQSDFALFSEVYHRLGAYISRAQYESLAAKAQAGSAEPPLKTLARMVRGSQQEARIIDAMQVLSLIPNLRPADAAIEAWLLANGSPAEAADRHRLDILCALAPKAENAAGLLSTVDALAARADAPEAERAPVALSTIHAAKGLEFDRVILIDLIDGVLPAEPGDDALPAASPAAAEEEARLFYVGITRARDSLELVSAARGFAGKREPSPFVGALTSKLRRQPR